MTSSPLERLCAHRGVDVSPVGELLDLAPVLNVRAADLLAIAGTELPAEYLPVAAGGPEASRQIVRLCVDRRLGAASTAMRRFADSLPHTPRAKNAVGLPAVTTPTFGVAFKRLMLVRNLDRRALAMATGSAQSTINGVMADYRLPSAPRMLLIAAALCLSGDDVEAMAAHPGDDPSADSYEMESAVAEVPRLWALGELICSLAPLQAHQIDAVVEFGERLVT